MNLIESRSSLLEPEQEQRPGTIALFLTLVRFVAEHTRQALRHRIARVSMHRVRRDPAAVTTALRSARHVLIVCHGNIIRSAFAAHLLRQRLGPACPVCVTSAGLEAIPGRLAHPIALRIARRLSVDLSGHTASRVSEDDVRASDVVFAVDVLQFVALRKRFPEARKKTFLLTCLAPFTPLEIVDPVNGNDQAFEVCFSHITRAVGPIGRVIAAPPTSR